MSHKHWKQISSKVLFEHSRITLSEDEVELPSGHKTTYLKYSSNSDAATVIARREGKVLMQKEYSYPPNQVLLQFPGGAVPKSEDIARGANRELMEEAGLRSEKLTKLGSYFINNR